MQLECGGIVHGFKINRQEELPEIEGRAYVGVHERSGARLLYLSNDDNNKSFAIGFRTPPADDTGVFHILEHSVLCGSRKFPVKEPFVDLLKGSMQTFLNAMTFADKTLYPVASTNEQDLFNLMDVYLDAVFHPRIYEKRAIFEQEGWHYELRSNDGQGDPAELPVDKTTLMHNGVVFNEMKGALSDANSVLYDELQKALFPDTCYAFESGGTPEAIPTLTYENYLDEHRRHYRTDNSYIILYGNMDIARTLEFLDERYLTPVAAEQEELHAARREAGLEPLEPRTIGFQHKLKASHAQRKMSTAPENACAACGYVIGTSTDRIRSMATEILLDALFGSNEAPLKRAILDAGLAHDVQAFVSDAVAQPFAIVQVQMPCEDGGARLMGHLQESVRALLEEGLDKSIVEASLSHAEFQMREHDMGLADGVAYSMISLSSWLYDDEAPIDYLRYERAFAELRSQLQTDYYERLCEELFCSNGHTASVEIVPAPQDDAAADGMLAALNASLGADDRRRIVDEERLLRQLQEAPDAPEAIATLPRLKVADIGDAPNEPRYDLDWRTPITCVRHSVATRGIVYAYRYFDMDRIAFDELPYLSILALVLGKLDTELHTAAEVDTLVQGKLGNLSFFTDVYENRNDPLAARPKFVVGASALSANVEALATLPVEIMTKTSFSDADRVLDVLKQRKIGLEQGFANAGHSCASARCKSYYSAAGVINEQISNVDFYRFLCELIADFGARAEGLTSKLADIAGRLFSDDACTVSFAGADEDYDRFWLAKPGCGVVPGGEKVFSVPAPQQRNEAFIVPTDVCYATLGWDRRLLGDAYDGSWLVAGRALSLDYLWNEVRVKGGAYGTGFQALRSGNMRFYSYRDPHLDSTLERFEAASEWLAGFEPSDEDLQGFIVASVASLDAPIKPRELVRRQMGEFFALRKPDERRELRSQVIATQANSVRALAPTLARMAEHHAVCVFGNKDILEASSAGLEVIPLVG